MSSGCTVITSILDIITDNHPLQRKHLGQECWSDRKRHYTGRSVRFKMNRLKQGQCFSCLKFRSWKLYSTLLSVYESWQVFPLRTTSRCTVQSGSANHSQFTSSLPLFQVQVQSCLYWFLPGLCDLCIVSFMTFSSYRHSLYQRTNIIIHCLCSEKLSTFRFTHLWHLDFVLMTIESYLQ